MSTCPFSTATNNGKQLADIIEIKDQWLVGHVIDPRGLIPSDTELSIARGFIIVILWSPLESEILCLREILLCVL